MMRKLEKYLAAHRLSLDVESPDDASVWKGIEEKLRKETASVKVQPAKVTFLRIRNIAAAALILFSLGYIANDIINGRLRNRSITLSSIDRALGIRENEYKALVSIKTEEVRSFAGSGDPVIKELFKEIQVLDTLYDQAVSDLGELGSNEKVINAIFRTYEQKIRILELIILEINKINSHENNEKISL
jgi:hypothetical protein